MRERQTTFQLLGCVLALCSFDTPAFGADELRIYHITLETQFKHPGTHSFSTSQIQTLLPKMERIDTFVMDQVQFKNKCLDTSRSYFRSYKVDHTELAVRNTSRLLSQGMLPPEEIRSIHENWCGTLDPDALKSCSIHVASANVKQTQFYFANNHNPLAYYAPIEMSASELLSAANTNLSDFCPREGGDAYGDRGEKITSKGLSVFGSLLNEKIISRRAKDPSFPPEIDQGSCQKTKKYKSMAKHAPEFIVQGFKFTAEAGTLEEHFGTPYAKPSPAAPEPLVFKFKFDTESNCCCPKE